MREVVSVVVVEVEGRFVGREDEAVECKFVISDVEAAVGEFEAAKVEVDSVVVAANGLVIGPVLGCSPFEACIEAVLVAVHSHCRKVVTGASRAVDLELAVGLVEEEACHSDLVDVVQEASLSDTRSRVVLAEVAAVLHDSVGRLAIP